MISRISLFLYLKIMTYHAGDFFGVDVGGSLAKIALLAPAPELLADLSPPVAAAISKVSKFVVNREKYGATGIRDPDLALQVEGVGVIHFIRYLRYMPC